MQKALPSPINLGKLQELAQKQRQVQTVQEPVFEKQEAPSLTFWLGVFGFWALSVGVSNPFLGTLAWAIAFAVICHQKSYLYKKCK